MQNQQPAQVQSAAIPLQLLEATLQYLAQKPLFEVENLVNALRGAIQQSVATQQAAQQATATAAEAVPAVDPTPAT